MTDILVLISIIETIVEKIPIFLCMKFAFWLNINFNDITLFLLYYIEEVVHELLYFQVVCTVHD